MYYLFNEDLIRCLDLYTKSISGPCSVDHTQKDLGTESRIARQGVLDSEENPPPVQKQAITTFVDENPAEISNIRHRVQEIARAMQSPDAELANFLARPVKLSSMAWTVGSGLTNSIFPWKLWASNKRVANRLSNFTYFRAKLHVKYIVNGNPFYWGNALVDYTPCIKSPGGTENRLTVIGGNNVSSKCAGSQRPHIFIDSSTSKGGELELPFFYQKPFLDLTVASEVDQMGTLSLQSMAPLYHPSSTNPINISVYAWATEVMLGGPTQTNVAGLTPQGADDDEYEKKPISETANYIAEKMGTLTNVPTIGPYAVAAEKGARMVGAAASAMGYSKPTNLETPKIARVENVANLAIVDDLDRSNLLSLASKNQVSVDPGIAGLPPVDELSHAALCSKQSFIGSFDWLKSNDVNTKLLTVPLTLPHMVEDVFHADAAGKSAYIATGASAIALCYDRWRADICLRFQVVASAYHRGRLLIIWDPTGVNPTTPESNMTYSTIVDIGEKRDFTVTCGWGQSAPFLETQQQQGLALPEPIITGYRKNFDTSGGTFICDRRYENGVITVYVLNKLTSSGTDTHPIRINVFHSAKNAKFGDPSPDIANQSFFKNPTTPPAAKRETTTTGSIFERQGWEMPDETEDNIMLGPSAAIDDSALMFFGEHFDSVRPLLKRYCLRELKSQSVTVDPLGYKVVSANVGRCLIPRGWDSTSTETLSYEGGVQTPVNLTANSFLNHFANCYAGVRGSMRFKFVKLGQTLSAAWENPLARRTRAIDLPGVSTSMTVQSSDAKNCRALRQDDDTSQKGQMILTSLSNGSFEVTLPYYSYGLFFGPHAPDRQAVIDGISVRLAVDGGSDSSGVFRMEVYEAAGDDFSCFFWVGPPRIWMYRLRADAVI